MINPVEIPFTEPVSGRECELVSDGKDRGVRHESCPDLAEIVLELDAFYCTKCHMNGRISGAWVVSAERLSLGF